MIKARTLAALLGARREGPGWRATCPAHDDSSFSLSILETTNGHPALKCMHGCRQQSVIDALQRRGFWPSTINLTPDIRFESFPRHSKLSSRHKNLPIITPSTLARRVHRDELADPTGFFAEGEIEPEEKTPVHILLSFVANGELFHTSDGEGFITFSVGEHEETWPIRNRAFRQWLARNFYRQTGAVAGSQALNAAMDLLEAEGCFEGPLKKVNSRMADGPDCELFLDLGTENWEAVKITAQGWQVVAGAPVKFQRRKGMLSLPIPVRGGSIEQLRTFVNAPEPENWQLIVTWVLAALRPAGPFPVLCLQGEQGSAKSSTARFLRMLTDPFHAPLRSPPRSERDLMIAATNGWVLAYDNLSGLPQWLSNALCRLSTGGGFSTRALYTNSEEIMFDAMRPVLLNGIAEIPARNDLLDRALIVTLPQIPDSRRRTEKDLLESFLRVRPLILGAFLDAVVCALRQLPYTHLDELPRLADFMQWIAAAEPALPWKKNGFLKTYKDNRREASIVALASDTVTTTVLLFMTRNRAWTGTVSELLTALGQFMTGPRSKSPSWPKSARAFSGRLREAAPALRGEGLEIRFHREAHSGRRLVSFHWGTQ